MPNSYEDIINETLESEDATQNASTEKMPYEDTINELVESEENQFKAIANVGIKNDTQKSANTIKLAKQYNLPIETAEIAFDELSAQKQLDDYNLDGFYKKAPNIASKIDHPAKFSASKDSLENLSWFERFGGSISQGWQVGQDTLQTARLAEKEFFGQELTPSERNERNGLVQREQNKKDYSLGFVGGIPQAVLESLPLMADSFLSKEAFVGAGAGGSVGAGVGSLAGGVGALPTAIAGGATGYKTGSAVRMLRNETALAYNEFKNFKDNQGNLIDENSARVGAVVAGGISASLEAVGLKYVLKAFPAGSELMSSFTREGFRNAIKNDIARSAIQRVGTVLGAITAEGGTEALQEFSNNVVGEFTKLASGGDFTPFEGEAGFWGWLADVSEKSAEAGIKGAQGGAGFAGAGLVVSEGIKQTARIKRAVLEKKQIDKLVEEAEKAPLAKNNPDLFLELTDNPDQKIYVGATEFQEFFQNKQEQFEIFKKQVPEVVEQINEALETGGDLVLPANKVALALGNTDIKNITDIMRITPDSLTKTDGANIEQSQFLYDDYFDEADSSSTIRQNLESQLMNAGFTPDTARGYGEILSSFYDTQYSRTEQSPQARKELNNFFENLIFRNVNEAEQGISRVDNLELLIERAKIVNDRQGKLRERPILSFIRSRGGVQTDSSFAGDLMAMGVKKTSGVFRKEGRFGSDNIPASDFEDEFGVFGVPQDGQGYVDPNFISEAISQEMAGIDWREDYKGDTPVKQAKNLLNLLKKSNIDIKTASKDKIKQALQGISNEQIQDKQEDKLKTDTKEFKKWFGNSKVVDDKGNPLVMYHGTISDINQFKGNPKRGGLIFFTDLPDFATNYAIKGNDFENLTDKENFLKDNPDVLDDNGNVIPEKLFAKKEELGDTNIDFVIGKNAQETANRFNELGISVGSNIIPVYIKAEKLHDPLPWKEAEALGADYFKKSGYDGVRIIDDRNIETIAVFDPTQIKSVFNRGTFDPNDARILYQNKISDNYKFSFDEKSLEKNKQIKNYNDLLNEIEKDSEKWFAEKRLPSNIGERLGKGYWQDFHNMYNWREKDYNLVGKYKKKENFDSEISNLFGKIKHGITIEKQNEYAKQEKKFIKNSYERFKQEIDNFHKNSNINFNSVDGFPDNNILIYKSPTYNNKQSSEYRLGMIDGELAFFRKSNHWGKFTTNIKNVDDAVNVLGISKEMAEELYKSDAFGRVGVKLHDWNLKGGDVDKKNSQTGYVLLRDLIEGNALFQNKETKNFGSFIRTKDGLNIISLFKDRDLSTVLHESGHFFLEAFRAMAESPDAPQDIKADWEALRTHLEIDKDKILEAGENISVESHETFARGFEAYLMEGKAPSERLLAVFRRFKNFLTRIYRNVKNLNVSLNNDVRAIFDRMLATDTAINELKGKNIYRPDPEIMKLLTKAEQNDYIRRGEKQAQEAKEKLLAKHFKEAKLREERILEAERGELGKETTQRVMNAPVHKLRNFLKTGKMPDGVELPLDADKFDIDAVRDIYGEEYVKLLPKKFFKKDGQSPDIMADLFGFRDGGEMLNSLINAPEAKNEIKRSVEEEIDRRYGDPLNDGTIERDALDSAYTEARENNIAYEYSVITRKVKNIRVTKEELKNRAFEIINDMKMDDAIKPDKYYRAEVRSAGEANKHLANKDYEKAAQAKARQLLNHYLYKEARQARKFTDKTLKRFTNYMKPQVKGKVKIDEDYRKKAVEILDQFEFGSRKNASPVADLVDWIKEKEEQDGSQFIDPDLELIGQKKHYRDLSYSDFYSLVETIENIISQGKLSRAIEIEGKKIEINEIADSLSTQVSELFPSAKFPFEPRTRGEQAKRTFQEYAYSLLKAPTILRELDNFQENGVFYKYILKPVTDAGNRLVKRQQEVADKLNGLFDTHYNGRLTGDLSKKTFIPEIGESVTKQAMLSYALNWGAKENRKRIVSEANLTEEKLNAILSQLDTNDWGFVQGVWDYLGTFKDEIWALEKKRNGVEPKAVEIVPFSITTKDGETITLNGGYYPIKYEQLVDAKTQGETLEELQRGRGASAQTNRSHTKARAENVNKRVRNDLAVLFSHVSSVITDLEMGEVLQNSYRILKKRNVSSAIITAKGRPYYDQLDVWLKDLTVGGAMAGEGFGKILDSLRAGVSIATMGFKVSTVLAQITGVTQTASVIGTKNMLKGLVGTFGNGNPLMIKNSFKFAFEHSKILTERSETFNRDLFDAMRRMQSASPIKQKITQMAFYPMIKMQAVVDVISWHGAYQKGLVDFNGDDKKAIDYADNIVTRSQGSGQFVNLSAIERGTIGQNVRLNSFVRLFTTYYSYFNTKLNILYEKTQSTDFKKPKDVLGFATDFLLLFTIEAALGSMLLGNMPDDDEDMLSWLAKGTMDSFFAQLPIVREVYSGTQGFDASPAGMRGLGDISKAVGSVAGTIEDVSQGEDANYFRLARDLNMAGGIVFKYPASQMNQFLKAVEKESKGQDVTPAEYLLYRKQ